MNTELLINKIHLSGILSEAITDVLKGKLVMKKLIILFIIAYCSTGYCQQKAGTYEIEIIDGIRHIRNNVPLWGDNPEVSLEFVRQFGGRDITDENYSFYGPLDVSVDSKGNVYIVDQLHYRIQKYDPEGKYIQTFMRNDTVHKKFILPGALNIDENDKLYVNDSEGGEGVILILDTDGSEIDRLSTNAIVPRREDKFYVLPSGGILTESHSSHLSLLSVYTPDVDEQKPIGNCEERLVKYHLKIIQFTLNENMIYISFGHTGYIEKFTANGEQFFRAHRPVNFDTSIKMNPAGSTGLYTVSANKISRSIAVDGQKRIWVATYRRLEKEEEKARMDFSYNLAGTHEIINNLIEENPDLFGFDVFNDEGILLMQIPIHRYCDAVRIIDDRLFIVDRLRNMAVYEYKIVEK